MPHDGELILWDLTTGDEIRRFEGHENKVTGAAFSPDGSTAISADYDGVLILWDVTTGKEIRRFREPLDVFSHVIFSPDGRTVVTAGGSHCAGHHRLGRDHRSSRQPTQSGSAAKWTVSPTVPDGRYIAAGDRTGELIMWDAATGEEVRRFVGHNDAVNSLAFSPDSQTLLSGGTDIGLVLWNVATGDEIRRIEAGVVDAVAYSPDGKH